MTQASYSVFNAMVDIFAAPHRALDAVKGRTGWLWLPLLITLVAGAAAVASYAYWVDFEWYVEQTIRQLPPDAPPEAAQQTREILAPRLVAIFGAVAVVLMTLVIYLLQALYLHLANRLVTHAELRFPAWFSFSVWTAFVGIVNAVAMVAVMLVADSDRLLQHELVPLSFNELFIHAEPGDRWFAWGNALTIVNLWMLVLMAIGYRRWTDASLAASSVIVVLPWALIFGIWAFSI